MSLRADKGGEVALKQGLFFAKPSRFQHMLLDAVKWLKQRGTSMVDCRSSVFNVRENLRLVLIHKLGTSEVPLPSQKRVSLPSTRIDQLVKSFIQNQLGVMDHTQEFERAPLESGP